MPQSNNTIQIHFLIIFEVIKINIIGAQNIIDLCLASKDILTVLALSTTN